jgi:hypothetical protein
MIALALFIAHPASTTPTAAASETTTATGLEAAATSACETATSPVTASTTTLETAAVATADAALLKIAGLHATGAELARPGAVSHSAKRSGGTLARIGRSPLPAARTLRFVELPATQALASSGKLARALDGSRPLRSTRASLAEAGSGPLSTARPNLAEPSSTG